MSSYPPPPPQTGPTGWIDLTIQGTRFLSGWVTPTARLNGHFMPTRYGRNVYPVPPGTWQVDMEAQWTKTYGRASLTFQVQEGQTVPVFYCQPTNVFQAGNIGHTKQRKPGAWFYWVLAAVLVLIVLVTAISAVAGS
ncbi:MAG: hypothetical protein FWE71_04710 [Nocardioidaceae bacterium]|nr:hypothetical protein [Nocardioidaceae bacterium]MCL2612070.1 hypothetical protein [Nocardioidaceae bacterium]